MRRGPLAVSTASVVAVLAMTAVSCTDEAPEVVLGEVGRADVVEVVDAPATVVATAAATLSAVADGTLTELWVEPGEQVSAGDIVAVIDSPRAEEALEQAEEALAAADQAAAGGTPTQLSTAQAGTDASAAEAFEQAREAADHIADEDLRQAVLAQVEAAQEQYDAAAQAARDAVAAVEAGLASLGEAVAALGAAQQIQAEQAYELAEATVDALTLRAPLDGVVQLGGVAGGGGGQAELLDDLLAGAAEGGLPGAPEPGAGTVPGVAPVPAAGAPVTAGTPVVTVVDVSQLGLLAEVDETDVLLVEPGIRVEVELDAALGAGYPASVSAVDLLPTPSARGGVAYGVHLELGEGTWPDGRPAPPPRPGMSAVARLRVAEATGAAAVPAAAVLRIEDADVVWAIRDGRAERVPVTLGVQGPDLVEVTSGLAVGDRIVVGGADQVTEGQRLP